MARSNNILNNFTIARLQNKHCCRDCVCDIVKLQQHKNPSSICWRTSSGCWESCGWPNVPSPRAYLHLRQGVQSHSVIQRESSWIRLIAPPFLLALYCIPELHLTATGGSTKHLNMKVKSSRLNTEWDGKVARHIFFPRKGLECRAEGFSHIVGNAGFSHRSPRWSSIPNSEGPAPPLKIQLQDD